MKQLWAPWRMEFIESNKGGGKGGGCIFCPPLVIDNKDGDNKDDDNKDGLVLYKGTLSTVLLNKFPYNCGHLLIAPTKHTALIEDLSDKENADLMRMLAHAKRALADELAPEGFNAGINLGKAAGAGITDHLHWHLVPRWTGDVNFMPLLSETRVIPEHLSETARRLRPYFSNIDES